MKKIKYFISLFGIVSIFLVGCSNVIENEERYIQVQHRIGDENKYANFKEITNNEQVQKVKDILNEIDWEHAKVNMTHPPDYRFIFPYKNPKVESKAVTYELWITPNNDKVELVIDAESNYVQLDTGNSAELFEILVGEELSDQK